MGVGNTYLVFQVKMGSAVQDGMFLCLFSATFSSLVPYVVYGTDCALAGRWRLSVEV